MVIQATVAPVPCEWTRPHYDVTHAKNCPHPYQISMSVFKDGSARIYILNKSDRYHAFTPLHEFFGPEKDAREKGGEWLALVLSGLIINNKRNHKTNAANASLGIG